MVDIDQSIRNYDLAALEGGAGMKSLDYTATSKRPEVGPPDGPLREPKKARDRKRRESKQRKKAERLQVIAELDDAIATEHVNHECEGSCPTCLDDRFAWHLIAAFLPLIQQAVTAQVQRAGRYVATWEADIETLVTDRIHHELLRQRLKEREGEKCWGSENLGRAAFFLSKQDNLPGSITKEQVGDDTVAECAAWLLSVAYNASLDAIRTWLRRYAKGPNGASGRPDQLIRFEAVEASGTLWGADEFLSHHKVDDLTMHGHRYPAPGRVNREYLAVAISAWVTDRKLDPLVEVLINDEWVNTDGTFRWTEHADKVWAACGLPVAAFESLPNHKARAEAAKKATRNRFADLPDAISQMASALMEQEVDLGERGIRVTQMVTPEQRAKHVAARLLEALEGVL